ACPRPPSPHHASSAGPAPVPRLRRLAALRYSQRLMSVIRHRSAPPATGSTAATSWPHSRALRGMLRVAGSWSTSTARAAPSGIASSASRVRTKVYGHTSPRRSSSPGRSEEEDAIRLEDLLGHKAAVKRAGVELDRLAAAAQDQPARRGRRVAPHLDGARPAGGRQRLVAAHRPRRPAEQLE